MLAWLCVAYETSMSKLTCVRSKHNPNQTYEEFKQARLQGFGASDMGDLLNEGDYSCKRKLFLERLGLMPEKQDDRLKFHVERGKFFEAPVAQLYQLRTGRGIKLCGTAHIKEYPFMRANADRLQAKNTADTEIGVLEIKVPGEHMFRKIKKEGLPKSYILQLQWQMLCYGVSWGSFAVYWADGHELLHFDVERDEELIQGLIEVAKREWRWLDVFHGFVRDDMTAAELFPDSAFPVAVDAHSKACEKCPMFDSCHGITFDREGLIIERNDLEDDANRFLSLKAEIKLLEAEEKELKASFRAAFVEYPCSFIKAGKFNIKVSERSRESVSSKVKEILTPEESVLYVKQNSYEVIDVKESK